MMNMDHNHDDHVHDHGEKIKKHSNTKRATMLIHVGHEQVVLGLLHGFVTDGELLYTHIK